MGRACALFFNFYLYSSRAQKRACVTNHFILIVSAHCAGALTFTCRLSAFCPTVAVNLLCAFVCVCMRACPLAISSDWSQGNGDKIDGVCVAAYYVGCTAAAIRCRKLQKKKAYNFSLKRNYMVACKIFAKWLLNNHIQKLTF